MAFNTRLNELTKNQSGLFTSTQAAELGMTREDIRLRLVRGTHVHVAPRVYALAGMPVTERVLLHAALLEASGRSAVSHESAAAHWELSGFTLVPFHITRLRDGTFEPATRGTIHTTRRLPDSHLVDDSGLLVTTPTRTLFDLAPRVGSDRLERLIDVSLSRGLTSVALLRRTLQELSGKGQRGITVMRELIDVRLDGYVPVESGVEMRFVQVLREVFPTSFRRQVVIRDAAGFVARVDFAHEQRMLIVEIDSDLHHTSISDVRADHFRQQRLEALGWVVLRITEHEVWHQVDTMIRHVRAALARAPMLPDTA